MKRVGNWWLTDDDKLGKYLDNAEHVSYMSRPKDLVDFAMTHNITNAIEKHTVYNNGATTSHDKVLIDVGASYGFVANRVAKMFDRVHCFEVLDDVRECLRLNVADHRHVVVHPMGCSDRERDLYIGYIPSHTMLSGVSLNQVQYTDRVEMIVSVRPIDDSNIANVTCMKIDVEGHEKHVLLGARNTLMSPVVPTVVFVECWDKGEYYDKQRSHVLSIMESYGYSYCGTAVNVVKKNTKRTDDMIFKRGWRQVAK